MTIEEYDRAFETHQGPPPVQQSTALGVQPQRGLLSLPPVWEETNEMSKDELTYKVYVHPTPPPVNGSVGQPIGPNMRVTTLPPATLIIDIDDDDESYTGSSDGINDNENIITLSPTSPLAPVMTDAANNCANVGTGVFLFLVLQVICHISLNPKSWLNISSTWTRWYPIRELQGYPSTGCWRRSTACWRRSTGCWRRSYCNRNL